MRKLLIIAAILFSFVATAQPPIQRSNSTFTAVDTYLRASKGFGVPIYSDTTNFSGLDSLGTLIYVKLEGMYFRDTIDGVGRKWVLLVPSYQNYWTLNGTDLYTTSTSYDVGIGTSNPEYRLDVQNGGRMYFDGTRLGLYDNSSRNNILIGSLSGASFTSSHQDNIAIGFSSNRYTQGDYNVSVGSNSLQFASGNNNAAFGFQSLYLTDSSENSAFGYTSGLANYGKQNTSIGSRSGNYAEVDNDAIANTEISVGTSNFSGAGTAAFISANSLSVGVKYSFSLAFNGTAPEPYASSGVSGVYINGTVTDASTIDFDGSTFTTQGTSTTTVTLFNKQNNAIAIGYNARTDSTNQIVLGNSDNSILKINQFVVDLKDAPATGEVLTWDGTKAIWDTIVGGGGGAYSFLSPLSELAGVVSIDNAAANGSTKGAASFTAADFNASSGNISIDYTNGQAASTTLKGFLTNTDWNTFNNKLSNITGYITAGTNVSFTGTGTSGDPYVISSSGGGGGITTLNTLTAATQFFAVGTTGTSPSWSVSGGNTHTINIPTTSASNTGLVTPTLYNTWNAKQDAITGAATTIVSSNLTSSRVVVSSATGKVDVSTVTSTDLLNFKLLHTSQALSDGATITMNCANGYVGTVTIAGSRNITFSNVTNWYTMRIMVTQGGSGNYTLTFPANTIIPVGFGSGTTLNLSTAVGAVDEVYVDYNGTNYMVTIAKDFVN